VSEEPFEDWRKILAAEMAAPKGSVMFDEVRAARSDLEGRGVLRSGMTAEKADHLAAKYGYRWDQGSKTYRRTLRSRIGPPWLVAVALVFAIVGFVAPFTDNRAVAGVISSVTVLAAFGALGAMRR
jgi:hypothetical protein